MVQPRGDYFFHTAFGPDSRSGWTWASTPGAAHQETVAAATRSGHDTSSRALRRGARRAARLPDIRDGRLPGRAWQECADRPPARRAVRHDHFADDTALHFADLRIYAADGGSAGWADPGDGRPGACFGSVKSRIRQLRPSR